VTLAGANYQTLIGGNLYGLFGTSTSSPVVAAFFSLVNAQVMMMMMYTYINKNERVSKKLLSIRFHTDQPKRCKYKKIMLSNAQVMKKSNSRKIKSHPPRNRVIYIYVYLYIYIYISMASSRSIGISRKM
jgi:hypothetical protein